MSADTHRWTQIGTKKEIRFFATEITENTERNKRIKDSLSTDVKKKKDMSHGDHGDKQKKSLSL